MGRNLVLDAGALIGFEHGSKLIAALLKQAQERGDNTVIPASALSQVWRGGPKAARLSRLIEASQVDVLDEKRAREVGVKLGACGRNDVVDAHVVCCAAEHEAIVATSDQGDIDALIGPDEVVSLLPV